MLVLGFVHFLAIVSSAPKIFKYTYGYIMSTYHEDATSSKRNILFMIWLHIMYSNYDCRYNNSQFYHKMAFYRLWVHCDSYKIGNVYDISLENTYACNLVMFYVI